MTKPLPPTHAVTPLLAAKYTVPPVRPNAVIRPRLHHLLLRNATTRLTIVTAPAGWGKTTLLSQWAHDPVERRQIAWVSLDEADDEPTRFWSYVLTALQRIGLASDALGPLGVPGVDPLTVAVPTLLNELESAELQAVLVLDDYHVLSDQQVHEGVEFLLTYLPASLRMVISGRADPALPLPRLRASGELTEIRMHELSFSVPEAGELVAAVGAVELDPQAVGGLCERTEGWAAGLQLAALTLREDAAPAVDAIRGDDRHILDYFSSEVLAGLTPDQRDLLVPACVLERLSGALCDTALERSGSADILAQLDRANLFVAPLDTHREWYRCHPLFRDALRRELPAEVSGQVLSRAAEWFQARGYLDDAIEHRILAGDTSGAAELLRSAAPWFLERGPRSILRLAERLPGTDVRSDPRLCLSLASAAALDGQFDRMEPWLDAAEPLITDDAPGVAEWHDLRAALATMRAIFLLSQAETDGALSHAQNAVELETDPRVPGYALCRHILGTAYLAEERRAEAIPVLTASWRQARALHHAPLLALQAACSLALALYDTARFMEAENVCTQTTDAARSVEQAWGDAAAPWIAQLQMIKGRLAHRAGDLTTARQLLQRSVALSRIWGFPTQLVMALTSLAEAELSAGERAAAYAAISEAREIVESDAVWLFVIRELEDAELRVGRGAVKARRRQGRLVEELTDRELSILRMLPGSANQREIGGALFLSINTVKGYAKSLYRKLDVSSRQEAVERARELGLI